MNKHRGANAGGQGNSAGIVAADFPAVREFLRGYLNQDFADEYGTVEAATKAFCEDASASEIRELAKQWGAFRAKLGGASRERMDQVLSGTFHSGWRVSDGKQLDLISEILENQTS